MCSLHVLCIEHTRACKIVFKKFPSPRMYATLVILVLQVQAQTSVTIKIRTSGTEMYYIMSCVCVHAEFLAEFSPNPVHDIVPVSVTTHI